jgi:hypothetical protein
MHISGTRAAGHLHPEAGMGNPVPKIRALDPCFSVMMSSNALFVMIGKSEERPSKKKSI